MSKEKTAIKSMTQSNLERAEKLAKKRAELAGVLSLATQKLLVDLSLSLPANALVDVKIKQALVGLRVSREHPIVRAPWVSLPTMGHEYFYCELPLPLSADAEAGLRAMLYTAAPEAVEAVEAVEAAPVVEAAPAVEAKPKRARKSKAVSA